MQPCDLCHARRQLKAAMDAVEAIPDFDVAMFDEPIAAAYYALDEAHHVLLHECDYGERGQDAAGSLAQ